MISIVPNRSLHYSTNELCSNTLTSDSVRSIEIPTSGGFILESKTGPMNTAHELSDVMLLVLIQISFFSGPTGGGGVWLYLGDGLGTPNSRILSGISY